jgi:hypothetical protein
VSASEGCLLLSVGSYGSGLCAGQSQLRFSMESGLRLIQIAPFRPGSCIRAFPIAGTYSSFESTWRGEHSSMLAPTSVR